MTNGLNQVFSCKKKMFNKCGDRFLYINTILEISYEIIKHNKNKQKRRPCYYALFYSVFCADDRWLRVNKVSCLILGCRYRRTCCSGDFVMIWCCRTINGKVLYRFNGWLNSIMKIIGTIFSLHRRVIKPIYFRRCVIGCILGVVSSICYLVRIIQTVICENYGGLIDINSMRLTTARDVHSWTWFWFRVHESCKVNIYNKRKIRIRSKTLFHKQK